MSSHKELTAHLFRLVHLGRSVGMKRALTAVNPDPRLNFWRLIHGNQLDVIEIRGLPQLLGQLQLILPLLRRQLLARNLQILPLARLGQDPFAELQAERGVPKQVGAEYELLAVPRVKIRAGIREQLLLANKRVGYRFEDVLRHAVDPYHPHHVGLL